MTELIEFLLRRIVPILIELLEVLGARAWRDEGNVTPLQRERHTD